MKKAQTKEPTNKEFAATALKQMGDYYSGSMPPIPDLLGWAATAGDRVESYREGLDPSEVKAAQDFLYRLIGYFLPAVMEKRDLHRELIDLFLDGWHGTSNAAAGIACIGKACMLDYVKYNSDETLIGEEIDILKNFMVLGSIFRDYEYYTELAEKNN